ncbi:MAG: hypothetical protein LLG93_09350 [Deltaproteobacteria bacterium]|nr:hypothetical protein [Deltaproteobacteria bacterium]
MVDCAAQNGSDLERVLKMWERMGKQTRSAKPTTADPVTKTNEVPAEKK